jgi:hypothetical protein
LTRPTYGNFKCNHNHIYECHNLSNCLRELYQWPGIAEITDIAGIKRGYYAIHDVNPTGIGAAAKVRSGLTAGAKRLRTLGPTRVRHPRQPQGSLLTPRWREMDSNLYGAFPVKELFWFIVTSLFGAGKCLLRPVACDQVRGARGRGQGTETLAKLGGMPPSGARVSQRLDA